MATICTVGYGDIYPTSSDETCFVIFLMLIGLAAYSLIMGGITSTERVPTIHQIQHKKIIDIEEFL